MIKKKRIIYWLIAFLSFVACIMIVKGFSDNLFIRGFVGDIVATVMMYFFIKTIKPLKPKTNLLSVLIICYTIEILQGIHFVDLIGLGHIPIVRTVFGAVFDLWDLIAYSIGGGVALGIDLLILEVLDLN